MIRPHTYTHTHTTYTGSTKITDSYELGLNRLFPLHTGSPRPSYGGHGPNSDASGYGMMFSNAAMQQHTAGSPGDFFNRSQTGKQQHPPRHIHHPPTKQRISSPPCMSCSTFKCIETLHCLNHAFHSARNISPSLIISQ